jgi:hypothetical protein
MKHRDAKSVKVGVGDAVAGVLSSRVRSRVSLCVGKET